MGNLSDLKVHHTTPQITSYCAFCAADTFSRDQPLLKMLVSTLSPKTHDGGRGKRRCPHTEDNPLQPRPVASTAPATSANACEELRVPNVNALYQPRSGTKLPLCKQKDKKPCSDHLRALQQGPWEVKSLVSKLHEKAAALKPEILAPGPPASAPAKPEPAP